MGWGGRLEKLSFVSIVVSLVSALGPVPTYNVTLPLFALVATHTRSGKLVVAAVIALFVSLIIDVIWMIINHSLITGFFYVSLIGTIANFLIKMGMLSCAIQLFVDLGGTLSLVDTSVPIERHRSGGGSFSSDFESGGQAGSSPYSSYQQAPAVSQASL